MASARGRGQQSARGRDWLVTDYVEQGRPPIALAVLEGLPVLHWHSDRFELPTGAAALGSTALCPYQAFAVGQHALALQFYAEVDPTKFEHRLVAYAAELSAHGIDRIKLRQATISYAGSISAAAPKLLSAWLDALWSFCKPVCMVAVPHT